MKSIKYIPNVNRFKDDPIGSIIDLIITIIVNVFTPLKVSPEVVAQLKMPIISLIVTVIILFLMLIMFIGTIILFPATLGGNFLQNLGNIGQNGQPVANDDGFVSTSSPKQNPFGGEGLSFTSVTAHYLDQDYFIQFGINHTGTDFVPSQTYYKNSKTYKETNKVIIFSTMNGSARYFVDGKGGKTVEVINKSGTFKTIYKHFSSVFVESGDVTAGTPLGVMGGTGFSTGDHLHYEVWTKDNNSWKSNNPLNYIK